MFRVIPLAILIGASATAQVAPLSAREAFNAAFVKPASPPFIMLFDLRGNTPRIGDGWIAPRGPVQRFVESTYQVRVASEAPPHEIQELPEPRLRGQITIEFDERGRQILEMNAEGRGFTRFLYEGDRLVADESFRSEEPSRPLGARRLTYNPSGQLADIQVLRGDEIQNHYTDFKYDRQGLLTEFAYRQAPGDALFSRTLYKYSEDSRGLEVTESDAKGSMMNHQVRTLDSAGRVLRAVVTDRFRQEKKQEPINVTFRYDAKSRLIEQYTPPYDSHELDEHDILPGQVTIEYDDAIPSQVIAYRNRGDRVVTKTRFDSLGNPVDILIAVNDEERSHHIWDCIYDARGNWTECRQFSVYDDGEREIQGLWRREITYR